MAEKKKPFQERKSFFSVQYLSCSVWMWIPHAGLGSQSSVLLIVHGNNSKEGECKKVQGRCDEANSKGN